MNNRVALGIDTVSEMCSVALMVNDELLTRQSMAINRHSDRVLGMVDELLVDAGKALTSLDLIVCDVGPGSFTGIRIGIGVAQGLAYGADLPLVGVDALSTLAAAARQNHKGNIVAAMDARMAQVYWALFAGQTSPLAKLDQLHLSHPEELTIEFTEPARSKVVGIGSGWDAYEDILKKACPEIKVMKNSFPLAEYGLPLGQQYPQKAWLTASQLRPVYLRNQVAKVSTKRQISD